MKKYLLLFTLLSTCVESTEVIGFNLGKDNFNDVLTNIKNSEPHILGFYGMLESVGLNQIELSKDYSKLYRKKENLGLTLLFSPNEKLYLISSAWMNDTYNEIYDDIQSQLKIKYKNCINLGKSDDYDKNIQCINENTKVTLSLSDISWTVHIKYVDTTLEKSVNSFNENKLNQQKAKESESLNSL